MFALVDCNNFYVSCERAFNPALEKKPVVVLSNNDGCIISRSNEAKKMGIPMGAPFYQWKIFCAQNHVRVFSSNYELYGDMSERVMTLLKLFNPVAEIYSIDEAFLVFDRLSLQESISLREQVKASTGIPISIGIGPTKTLAKAANQLAKNNSQTGVFYLETVEQRDIYLSSFPVEKIWGIGRKLSDRLKNINIDTAKKLRDSDPKMLRMQFNVTVEKTIQELKGISCLGLEAQQPRKQIISSRSFGKVTSNLNELEEAVSHYMNIAAAKLRQQESVAAAVYVFLQTNRFRENQPQYGNSSMFQLPIPTADTGYLISIAKKCLRKIYKKEYQYHKAGVILMDISSKHTRQYDMLHQAINPKAESVMAAIDHINHTMGKNTLYFAAEGIQRAWMIKCDKRSRRYTTRWHELPIVNCK